MCPQCVSRQNSSAECHLCRTRTTFLSCSGLHPEFSPFPSQQHIQISTSDNKRGFASNSRIIYWEDKNEHRKRQKLHSKLKKSHLPCPGTQLLQVRFLQPAVAKENRHWALPPLPGFPLSSSPETTAGSVWHVGRVWAQNMLDALLQFLQFPLEFAKDAPPDTDVLERQQLRAGSVACLWPISANNFKNQAKIQGNCLDSTEPMRLVPSTWQLGAPE